MGKLEEQTRRRAKKDELKKIILETIKVAGIIGIAIVAPNVIGAMVKLGLIASPRQKYVVERARDRLLRSGHLRRDGTFLRLTEKGERVLRNLSLRDYRISKPLTWDGKWRIIIFDIPEYRSGLRQKIRQTLTMMGFVRLQNSVWAYPYDCEDLMMLLKADFKVGKDVLYMVVDALEYDVHLRNRFGLRKT